MSLAIFDKLILLLSLVALVAGQGSVIPQAATTAASSLSSIDCGGCYVVAGVAAVVFGDEVVTATNTQLVSVGVGKNGTRVTTSFALPGGGQFTFNPSGLITGEANGATQIGGSVITINGATLTSPTAYNVFTAYSETQLVVANGVCSTTVVTTSTVSPAFSVPIPANADPNFIYEAEMSFIAHVGRPSCAPLGVVVSSTTAVQLTTTAVTSTVTGALRPTPVAQSTVPSSTAAPSTETESTAAASTGESSASPTTAIMSTVSLANNATGTLVISGNATGIITGSGPSATIIPFLGAGHAVFAPSMFVTAAVMLVPGLLAVLL